ncbi:MAG: hypothetical protein HQK60_07325 [Deltaproteobacteria bacterium]|nr:hypothetical protein [Deltaproteobacteria bacterium]
MGSSLAVFFFHASIAAVTILILGKLVGMIMDYSTSLPAIDPNRFQNRTLGQKLRDFFLNPITRIGLMLVLIFCIPALGYTLGVEILPGIRRWVSSTLGWEYKPDHTRIKIYLEEAYFLTQIFLSLTIGIATFVGISYFKDWVRLKNEVIPLREDVFGRTKLLLDVAVKRVRPRIPDPALAQPIPENIVTQFEIDSLLVDRIRRLMFLKERYIIVDELRQKISEWLKFYYPDEFGLQGRGWKITDKILSKVIGDTEGTANRPQRPQ